MGVGLSTCLIWCLWRGKYGDQWISIALPIRSFDGQWLVVSRNPNNELPKPIERVNREQDFLWEFYRTGFAIARDLLSPSLFVRLIAIRLLDPNGLSRFAGRSRCLRCTRVPARLQSRRGARRDESKAPSPRRTA